MKKAIVPEIHLPKLIEEFGSEQKCRAFMEALRWPKGVKCPRCGSGRVSRIKARPQFDCDFSHVGWANLKKAVEVRNRLVHPKTIDDLKVSDDELAMAQSALGWFLAMVILALRENVSNLKDVRSPE